MIAVKDNFVTERLPTTCASSILNGFTGNAESTVCRILQEVGMDIAGKTNMDEFGMGSHSQNSAYGPVQNGFGKNAQSPGGSSGGSAMAVADGIVSIAIGSDTGGSVRLPAAYTGTVGFKPSYGRISRNGLVPYANSLDTVGIIARNTNDVMALFQILDKYDPADPTSLRPESRTRIHEARRKRQVDFGHHYLESEDVKFSFVGPRSKGETPAETSMPRDRYKRYTSGYLRRIGVPNEYNIAEMHPVVRQAWLRTLSMLANKGHTIVPISLPNTKLALAAYYVLAPAEASSNLAKYDGVRYGTPRDLSTADNENGLLYANYRGEHFGEEVKRRILLGTFTLSAAAKDNYFVQAQKVRRLVQQDFNNVFAFGHPLLPHTRHQNSSSDRTVDLIIVPTAPTPPPKIQDLEGQSPVQSYINDVFTVPASLAGLPAISVPAAADEDIPATPDRHVGMQVIGQYGDDLNVLNFTRYDIEGTMNFDEARELTWSRKRM